MGEPWFKVSTGIFNNRKMKYLHSLKEGYAIQLCWFKLLALASIINDRGLVYLVSDVPYTAGMLAEEFKMPTKIVEAAMDQFEILKMIDVDQEGIIYINSWEEYQNEESLSKIREQNRARKQRQRERQRGIPPSGEQQEDDGDSVRDFDEDNTEDSDGQSRDSHVTYGDSERDGSREVTQQNKKENKKEKENKNNPPSEDRKERKKKESADGILSSCSAEESEEYLRIKPQFDQLYRGKIILTDSEIAQLVALHGADGFMSRCAKLAKHSYSCNLMANGMGHFKFMQVMSDS